MGMNLEPHELVAVRGMQFILAGYMNADVLDTLRLLDFAVIDYYKGVLSGTSAEAVDGMGVRTGSGEPMSTSSEATGTRPLRGHDEVSEDPGQDGTSVVGRQSSGEGPEQVAEEKGEPTVQQWGRITYMKKQLDRGIFTPAQSMWLENLIATLEEMMG